MAGRMKFSRVGEKNKARRPMDTRIDVVTDIVRRHVKQLLDDYAELDPRLLHASEMSRLTQLVQDVLRQVLRGKRASATPLQQTTTRNLERMVSDLDRVLLVDLHPNFMNNLVTQSFESQFQHRV